MRNFAILLFVRNQGRYQVFGGGVFNRRRCSRGRALATGAARSPVPSRVREARGGAVDGPQDSAAGVRVPSVPFPIQARGSGPLRVLVHRRVRIPVLKACHASQLVSDTQFRIGFERLFEVGGVPAWLE